MSPRRRKRTRRPAGCASVPPPKRPPWQLVGSLRAGLPVERDAWLARVLDVMRAEATHSATADVLGVPLHHVLAWWSWLVTERAAGRLDCDLPARTHWTQRARRRVLEGAS